MTGSEAKGRRARSGSGCATAVGFVLILAGGIALWANLAGAQLVLALLDLLPLAAVWWPAGLVVWGVWKLFVRLRTGEARFGFLEILLLLLVILLGTGLTLARRVIEGHSLQVRFAEISRWAEEQAAPLPQHVFVTDRVIGVPTEAVEITLTLPAGGILIRESAPAAPEGAAEGALPAPREARFRLTKRVWAASREEAASRAEAVRLAAGPEPGGARFSVGVEDAAGAEVAFDLVAALPSGVGISAVSGRGPVRIKGSFSGVSAQTSDGPLSVRGAGGEVSLVARDGAVHASEIAGPLRIRGRRGAIEVESVAGPVSVESDGAPVWIAHAGASVTVRGEDAPVEVSHAVGPVRVEAQIAPISLRQITRGAQVRSDYGPVLAVSVGGPLGIRTESAAVEVRGAALRGGDQQRRRAPASRAGFRAGHRHQRARGGPRLRALGPRGLRRGGRNHHRTRVRRVAHRGWRGRGPGCADRDRERRRVADHRRRGCPSRDPGRRLLRGQRRDR